MRDLLDSPCSVAKADLAGGPRRVKAGGRTAISAVPLKAEVNSGVWGMNFKHMPELGWTGGYPLAWFAIIASGVSPLIWFERRGWFE
ncbi:CorA family divalent cation transporter [Bradyrhizobium sp. AS23.2]|uniref:CorA family divalent cation transporter n=1 Tax=Bradyrhizobium sp. AS23.2 TaxID=1680155 RepID=UPI0009FA5EA0|nr:CorA family divalent cation transporter [Bradyrhizobium sp. AS23.2]